MSATAAPRLLDDDFTMRGTAEPNGFAAEWRSSYGRWWVGDLLFIGFLFFALGVLKPLEDPDLPMHLATGEWIVRHHGVPLTEPFAWTRAGAPYYAYSWAVEVLYYGALRLAGPAGLHVLNGLMLAGSGAAMLVLGWAARWRPWITLSMAGFSIGVASLIVPALRPQLVLLIAVPLAWAFTYRILEAERIAAPTAGLVASCALASNAHLFFVFTAAPLVLCWISPPRERRRTVVIGAAILAGWLLTPYGLLWPKVFELNFGYNALLVMPSPVGEFRSGFRAGFFGLVFAGALALIPWALVGRDLDRRTRYAYGALWLAGLFAFGTALRLLLAWWLIVLPVAALALESIAPDAAPTPPRPAVRWGSYAIGLLLLLLPVRFVLSTARLEGDVASRRLPSLAAPPVEPLASWIECYTDPRATGRIYTWFNYGSYLVWRLPRYSSSIDGRTIFPDSIAKPEALTSGLAAPTHVPAWPAADLVILPRRFTLAGVLDTADAWHRVAWAYESPEQFTTAALWVKRDWWQRWGRGPLPEHAVFLGDADSPLRVSPATGCRPGAEKADGGGRAH